MKKLNRVMQVPDSEVSLYQSNGYALYQPEEPAPIFAAPAELDTPEEPADIAKPGQRTKRLRES